MTTQELMEVAVRQQEELDRNVKKYESARSALELMENHQVEMYVVDNGELIQLMGLPKDKADRITEVIKAQYQGEIYEAHAVVEQIIKPKRQIATINEDFDRLFKTEEKAAENVENVAEAPKEAEAAVIEQNDKVAPVQPGKRVLSKDLISDAELKRCYFKDGLTIREIAEMSGAGAAGLYKRLELMKKAQEANEKECASSE